MDNIVRTWEEVELTDAQLEGIYGATQATLQGDVLGVPVDCYFQCRITKREP